MTSNKTQKHRKDKKRLKRRKRRSSEALGGQAVLLVNDNNDSPDQIGTLEGDKGGSKEWGS